VLENYPTLQNVTPAPPTVHPVEKHSTLRDKLVSKKLVPTDTSYLSSALPYVTKPPHI
jgi:hypothetical protein